MIYKQEYVPLSEFIKQKSTEPMVCSICGLEEKDGHCQISHVDHESRISDPNYNGVLAMHCGCVRCSPSC